MSWSWKRNIAAVLAAVLMMSALGILPAAAAGSPNNSVGGTTVQVALYLDSKQALLNGEPVDLAYPATSIDGRTFLPAKFLGDSFGFPVIWHEATQTIEMQLPGGSTVLLDQKAGTAYLNGAFLPWDSVAAIKEGTLLVQMSWICDLIGAQYSYDSNIRKIEVTFLRLPGSIYNTQTGNSLPTAKFAFTKPSYRLGEPVETVDLSYDADGDGLVKYEWSGKQAAYFRPGEYEVTLRVTDSQGNVSPPYTRKLKIDDIPYLTEEEYPFYYGKIGSIVPMSGALRSYVSRMPRVDGETLPVEDRKLLVSDSPETITEEGVLYRDTIQGKARIYAHHLNGTDEPITVAVMLTNPGRDPVTLRATNKGEVYPNLYAHLIGYQAAVDFLLRDPFNKTVTVPPGETRLFMQMPTMYPYQGINMIYDVETDGRLQVSVVASHRSDGLNEVVQRGRELPYNGHVRGTFVQSDVIKRVNAATMREPHHMLIADGTTDPYVQGYDVFRGESVTNKGNYGVTYKVHIDNPGEMALGIVARGGLFKGVFKINGKMVLAPQSGTLTAYDGVLLLHRTTGEERSLEVEFIPPAGSAFPISLVMYPLRKE
ncbi:copper amine oxidase N-terminal domain-containing protein [Xylanibacillus composti]|uniref:Copper amine oxidase-like N-terminal domain-containing protein n=1 Tax=Xylanibacillus composti TaxID=1572762 RepID=A0A8J4M2J5_9BACL|nr:stalk domain-containing protein [Xylanibacillus composti]MDT9726574.1 copper amine oxidase N-terminal domain-containing protein [Xylanibacillus composti]GIQ68992.1 hypothetical protein XYCOK13_18160 [Xylanibacillus composti]